MSAKQRDIHVGDATVPYTKYPYQRLPAGWALPGGLRTTNFERALQVAKQIDQLIKFKKAKIS